MTLNFDNRGRWGTVPEPQGSPFGASGSGLPGSVSSEAGSTGGHCCKIILILLLIAGIAGGVYYCGFSSEQVSDEPSPTPTPTARPMAGETQTPTLAPTATATEVPTATATPVPGPEATPTATPVSDPTGDWIAWPDLQAEGFEGDAGGLPRILLNSASLNPSAPGAALHIDCQDIDGRVQLELYVARLLRFPSAPPLPGSVVPDSRVEYSIDGDWRSGRTWDPSEWSVDSEAVFAPKTQTDDIIAGLKDGAQQLEFKVYWSADPEDPTTYRFSAEGFTRAFEPVDARCG